MKQFILILAFILVGVGLIFGPYIYTNYIDPIKIVKTGQLYKAPLQKPNEQVLQPTFKTMTIPKETISFSLIDKLFDYAQKLLGMISLAFGTYKIVIEVKKKPRRKIKAKT